MRSVLQVEVQMELKYTPRGTTYDGVTGILSVTTLTAHGLSNSDNIQFTNNSLVFKCSQDNYFAEKTYPRSTDPAANGIAKL